MRRVEKDYLLKQLNPVERMCGSIGEPEGEEEFVMEERVFDKGTIGATPSISHREALMLAVLGLQRRN
jgi:hypothetical protein